MAHPLCSAKLNYSLFPRHMLHFSGFTSRIVLQLTEGWLCTQTAWVHIWRCHCQLQDLSSLCLSFPFCKIGIIIVFNSQVCHESLMSEYK